MNRRFISVLGIYCIASLGFVAALAVPGDSFADGNRYNLVRNYHSEISAAEAYVLTNHDRGNKSADTLSNAVIIDVRTIDEYAEGHPPKSYNIPFPHIYNRQKNPDMSDYIAQDPVQFVNDVISAFPDRNTPILTLCRTGYRSVLAANLLADAGYINVRNIWQGFIGRKKVDTSGNTLDMDNNGVVGDLGDLDGWAGYQGLPVETQLHPKRIYAAYKYLYYQ